MVAIFIKCVTVKVFFSYGATERPTIEANIIPTNDLRLRLNKIENKISSLI